MPRNSLDAVVEGQLDEVAGGRYQDLRCDLVRLNTGEVILTAGGVWDAQEKAFAGPAAQSKILRLVESQIPAARWFAKWMAARGRGEHLYTAGGLPIFVLVLIGGRGSGKSNLSHKAALAYAVHMARSIVWFVLSVMKDLDEVVRDIEAELPPEWIAEELADPWYRVLVNGSEIHIKSAWDPEDLKRGRVDVVVIVEAQKHSERVLVKAAPRLADRGGLVIITANPPDTARGEWVDELCDKIDMGASPAVAFQFDASLNPTVDQKILSAMQHIMTAEDYEREIKGGRPQRRDVVVYGFSRPVNVHPAGRVPRPGGGYVEVANITRQVTDRFLHQRFDRVHGLDFQFQPMTSATWEFYEDPDDAAGFLAWCVRSITVVGNEDALIDELEADGFTGADAIVPDATGEYQNAERTKGKGSVEAFRKRGWTHVYLPDPPNKTNPPVSERLSILNGGLKPKGRGPLVYVDPAAPEFIRACRLWPAINGRPKPGSEWSHNVDAGSYPLCLFFPRRPLPGKFEFHRIPRPARGGAWGEVYR